MRAFVGLAMFAILFAPPNAHAEKKRKQRAPAQICGSAFCIENLRITTCGGVWCFAGVFVNRGETIRNLSMAFTGIDRDDNIIGEYSVFHLSVIEPGERWMFQANINGGGISRVEVKASSQGGSINELLGFRATFWNWFDERHWRKNHPDVQ